MPEKDGDEGKSTKSVVNKRQKQMMGQEGYDIARDMGRVRPSKDKKDATTMPVSDEVKKTQKVNKGPSAFERVKAKYGKSVMNVGKKKVKEELDLTKVAEAFGGYIVEEKIGTVRPGEKEATKNLIRRQAEQPNLSRAGQKRLTKISKSTKITDANFERLKKRVSGEISADADDLNTVANRTKSGSQSRFVSPEDRPTGEVSKPKTTRANYPKTRAELEAKRKEYEIDRQGKATDAGIEKFARRRKQSNLPLSQDELDSAKKAMVGTGEKGTDVGKYGGKLGRKRGKDQPTFAQVKADIDDRNPVRTSPISGGKIPDKRKPKSETKPETKPKTGDPDLERMSPEDRLIFQRIKDTTPKGGMPKGTVDAQGNITRIGKTSGDIIKTNPKTGKETEVTPSGRVKPIGTLGRRAEKSQQQSKLAAFGGFLAKSAVPATAGLEAAERLRKGEKGVALSAIQAMDIPVLSKAAGIMNAIQTVRRGQQAAADQQAMVDAAIGGGGGGGKKPPATSGGSKKDDGDGGGLAAVGGDGAETDTVTSRILATQLPNIGKRLRQGARGIPRGVVGGTVGRRSARGGGGL